MLIRAFLLLAISTSAFSQDSTSVFPTAALGSDTFNKQLMSELNAYRKRNLRWPVKYDLNPKYQISTDAWAKSISKKFRHAKGFYYAETIQHALSPESIIPRFMTSPGHRKALLARKAATVTVAVYAVPVKNGEYQTNNGPSYYDYFAVIRTYRKSKT